MAASGAMPEEFYMFGETHWGGCGCFGSTNSPSTNVLMGISLGFKFGEISRCHSAYYSFRLIGYFIVRYVHIGL